MADRKHDPNRRDHPQSWGEANHPQTLGSKSQPDMAAERQKTEQRKADRP